MELKCKCGFKGSHKECKKLHDKGWMSGFPWWINWFKCPNCKTTLEKVNQNMVAHPLYHE